MQNRMESNIRDKFLVKMIKLQEFTEKKRIAEMLNEMNPKLKALLAAGLIGTAGLGMQSCSNPSDSVYYPYTVEAPSTDNPGSGGAETSNPSSDEETSVVTATFESLHVQPAYRESLARAVKQTNNGEVKVYNEVPITEGDIVRIYRNGHFEEALSGDGDAFDDISENHAVIYICYADSNICYYVPQSMESEFDQARAVFNNAQ